MKYRGISIRLASGLGVLAMIVGVATAGPAVFAQQDQEEVEKITLSPSSREVKVDAGGTINGAMKIINNGTVPYDFTVYARPYSVSNEEYSPNFTDPRPNADLYKWVQFQKTNYSIEPGKTVEVPYVIRVPEGAAPGGHYGVLFAETQERETNNTGVVRQKRVGMVVYATVNGEYRTGGKVKEFVLPFWQKSAPVVSAVRVENTGNADFRVKVTTTAKDIFGRTKFRYVGDPIVLPETTRLAEMNWERAPSFGLFKVRQTADFLDKKQQNDGYILIAPVWFPIVLIGLFLVSGGYALRKRRKQTR